MLFFVFIVYIKNCFLGLRRELGLGLIYGRRRGIGVFIREFLGFFGVFVRFSLL